MPGPPRDTVAWRRAASPSGPPYARVPPPPTPACLVTWRRYPFQAVRTQRGEMINVMLVRAAMNKKQRALCKCLHLDNRTPCQPNKTRATQTTKQPDNNPPPASVNAFTLTTEHRANQTKPVRPKLPNSRTTNPSASRSNATYATAVTAHASGARNTARPHARTPATPAVDSPCPPPPTAAVFKPYARRQALSPAPIKIHLTVIQCNRDPYTLSPTQHDSAFRHSP